MQNQPPPQYSFAVQGQPQPGQPYPPGPGQPYPPGPGQPYPPGQGAPQGAYPAGGPVVGQPAQGNTTVVVMGPTCGQCGRGPITEDFTACGIILAICFFPLGIICCLMMKEKKCSTCGATF